MLRILPLLTALPLVISFGIVEGFWSDRWGFSQEAASAAARLEDVPLSMGEWDAHPGKLDAREIGRAEIRGYMLREYINRRTGNTLTVLIALGRPGPIAVHSPEVCF